MFPFRACSLYSPRIEEQLFAEVGQRRQDLARVPCRPPALGPPLAAVEPVAGERTRRGGRGLAGGCLPTGSSPQTQPRFQPRQSHTDADSTEERAAGEVVACRLHNRDSRWPLSKISDCYWIASESVFSNKGITPKSVAPLSHVFLVQLPVCHQYITLPCFSRVRAMASSMRRLRSSFWISGSRSGDRSVPACRETSAVAFSRIMSKVSWSFSEGVHPTGTFPAFQDAA